MGILKAYCAVCESPVENMFTVHSPYAMFSEIIFECHGEVERHKVNYDGTKGRLFLDSRFADSDLVLVPLELSGCF